MVVAPTRLPVAMDLHKHLALTQHRLSLQTRTALPRREAPTDRQPPRALLSHRTHTADTNHLAPAEQAAPHSPRAPAVQARLGILTAQAALMQPQLLHRRRTHTLHTPQLARAIHMLQPSRATPMDLKLLKSRRLLLAPLPRAPLVNIPQSQQHPLVPQRPDPTAPATIRALSSTATAPLLTPTETGHLTLASTARKSRTRITASVLT